MTSSPIDVRTPKAQRAEVGDDSLIVDLADGRTLVVPLGWYPRLVHATTVERADWVLLGRGSGIHWPRLDEDISIEDLIAGRPSGESQESLARWLAARAGTR